MSTRTEREAYLDRLILLALLACRDYPLPETALRDQLALRAAPPAATQEIDRSIAYLESKRRIDSVEGERSRLYTLTPAGRLHCQQEGIRL